MKNKIDSIIQDNKFKLIINIIVSFIMTLLLEKFLFKAPISFYRDLIVFISINFIGIHFIYKLADIYEFIYRKRYLLCLSLLLFLVSFGFTGTSLSFWDYYIQPEYTQQNYNPILGKARAIRSDEWVVNSIIDLSQSKLEDPFSSTNDLSRGTDTKVSLITKAPVKGINILVNPFKLLYMIFGNEAGISFWWYGRLLALFLLSFEFFMIFTNKNKVPSLVGSILVTFAPVVQWWFSTPLVDILIFGSLAIIIFDKFFKVDKQWQKILLSVAMAIVGACYICCYYPAWQITFGYVYLILFIWLLIKHKKSLSLKLIPYLLFVLIIVCLLVGYMLYDSLDAIEVILNTAYPGKRISTGGGGWQLLFTYFSSFMYSFKDIANPCENSQFISLFPIPLIVGCYFIIKNKWKNRDWLLILLVSLSILLLIWNFIFIPELIAKLTLLSMSTPQRAQVTIGYLMVLILVHLLANYSNKICFNKVLSVVVSLIVVCFGMNLVDKLFPFYLSAKYFSVFSILFFMLVYMFLSNGDKYIKSIYAILVFITLVPGITVNPVTKGLDVLYDKPLAKEIQKIEKKNPNSKWLVVSDYYLKSNYFVVNGASTINSVNIYPNLELWKKFDNEGKYEDIYNRYAHIIVKFTEEETYYEYVESYCDLIKLNLSYKDFATMDVDYLSTDEELDSVLVKKLNVKKIYDEYGMFIYEVKGGV